MKSAQSAEQSLRNGEVLLALRQLQDEVRAKPADAKLRIFLFQLLAVLGQWARALTQLNVAAELDPAAIAMAQMYREALHCEVLRAQVFEGRKSPMVFGQPEEWLALLIEALLLSARGQAQPAQALRQKAFDAAPPSSGAMDGKAFEWIADADMRLGPVLETIINGRYYWVPFAHLKRIVIDAPEDLRDVVWVPAHLRFDNGGESVALIPTRYPGSESNTEAQIVLAKQTIWEEPQAGFFCGLGQRIIATDVAEVPLMEVHDIRVGEVARDSDG